MQSVLNFPHKHSVEILGNEAPTDLTVPAMSTTIDISACRKTVPFGASQENLAHRRHPEEVQVMKAIIDRLRHNNLAVPELDEQPGNMLTVSINELPSNTCPGHLFANGSSMRKKPPGACTDIDALFLTPCSHMMVRKLNSPR